MASEVQGAFINCYEYLNVPQEAPLPVIQEAFDLLVASTEARLNNTWTMQSALYTRNVIVPAIRQYLLSGEEKRAAYDRELAAYQQQQAHRNELADDEGLDDLFRQPFFFDPFEGYDTETPAYSLRQIAMKLDEEWEAARAWITDTSEDAHIFLGFLTHVAGRQNLARRIAQIINETVRKNGPRMNTNEALERCITLLNPQVERPTATLLNPTFGGRLLDAGEFLSDMPAEIELVLAHEGVRGCVFGVIESRTAWATFGENLAQAHFVLMPQGTDPTVCYSEVRFPLSLALRHLERNKDHFAQLVIRMENHQPARELPILVHISLPPLPPRVVFEPEATRYSPILLGITRQGEICRTVITPRNLGDEQLIPLAGRITVRDPQASATPGHFHANEPITLTIDTRNRPRGQQYEVVFAVEYGSTQGVQGPAAVHVLGEILPTPWQSMLREKGTGQRAGGGCLGGFAGMILLGAAAAGLASRTGVAWFLLPGVPLMLALGMRFVRKILAVHTQRAGETQSFLERLPPWALWSIPAGIGLLLALLCMLALDPGTAFWLGGAVGSIVGFLVGFVQDNAGGSVIKSILPGPP